MAMEIARKLLGCAIGLNPFTILVHFLFGLFRDHKSSGDSQKNSESWGSPQY
jgi:hypothetical protein